MNEIIIDIEHQAQNVVEALKIVKEMILFYYHGNDKGQLLEKLDNADTLIREVKIKAKNYGA